MKTVDEIYEEMLDCFAEKTGVQAAQGGDLSARMYAVAAQVYALQVQGDWVMRQTFPQTAQGEWLDLHAAMRGLERKQAQKAGGVVRFTGESGSTVEQGTVCMSTGLVRFVTLQAGSIPQGESSVDVPVQAVLSGTGGNVPAGSVTRMGAAPVGVSSCTNPQAFTGGREQEQDEELRRRVLETYARLPNGANAAYYEQQALSFDQVAACCVLPRARGVGTVDVVVAAPAGIPDSELLTRLEDYFNARREIAVDVQVRAPAAVTVDLTVQVEPQTGYDFEQAKTQVQQAVNSWFTGERLGQNVLLAQLNSMVFACEGVANCRVTVPDGDVRVEKAQLPVLGALTVEEMT